MKHYLIIATFVVALFITGCDSEYDDGALIERINGLESRVAKLELLCNQMNTNIVSLQTIVTALQKQDCITGVTPVIEAGKIIGYTITFVQSSPITIYHGKNGEKGDKGEDGKDGEDGMNGRDGRNGTTPIVGVKKDIDGNYYWTLNGEWLYDDKGNRVIAQGTSGKDGEDGQDGVDGITPQLKIESGYWFISYDNGFTWYQIGPADGQDGVVLPDITPDVPDMFENVAQDDDYVYFTLADGTVITLPKEKAVSVVEKIKAVSYIPEASDGKATMLHVIGSSARKAELSFAVSPKGVISEIANNWQNIISAKAVNVKTRSVNYIDIPVLEFDGDLENGTISLIVSGENIEDRVFTGEESAGVAVTFDDGKYDFTTDFIPLLCKMETVPVTEIWYASSDGSIINPNMVDFGANIISNKYKDDKGLIKFDGVVTQVGESDADAYTVTRVGSNNGIFSNNELLEEIYISDKVTTIGDNAFYRCPNLRFASLGKMIETIGAGAFQKCENLKEVVLSKELKNVGEYAFAECYSLGYIELPGTLEVIDDYAFYECASLDGIVRIPSTVKRIGGYAFMDTESIDEIIVEEGVKEIGVRAFTRSGVKSIVLPSSVMFLGEATFEWCENLQSVVTPILQTRMFGGCKKLKKVVVSSSISEIPEAAFASCASLSNIELPSTIKYIGSEAFSMTKISEINIPDEMTEIKYGTFNACI